MEETIMTFASKIAFFVTLGLPLLGVLAQAQPATAPSQPGWKLVWSDEFTGTSLDRTKWTFDLGDGYVDPGTHVFVWGWGNSEMEYYTDSPNNVYVKDNALHIRALRERRNGSRFTSARLVTRGLFSKQYGRFEFRAKFPVGKGYWPALWLLPADNAYGYWAASGEIDVMEARGQNPNVIVGSILYGSRSPGDEFTSTDYALPDHGSISDYHVYTLEWEPGEMRWYVDDRLYSIKRNWWSCSDLSADGKGAVRPPAAQRNPWPAPFDKPFYLVMNLSVGGTFSGYPNKTVVFPQEMVVSYVRVYDKIGGYADAPPPGKDFGVERFRPDR
jgi:beta-glucanase (GH16 family)